jgi:hypothetical protein
LTRLTNGDHGIRGGVTVTKLASSAKSRAIEVLWTHTLNLILIIFISILTHEDNVLRIQL